MNIFSVYVRIIYVILIHII